MGSIRPARYRLLPGLFAFIWIIQGVFAQSLPSRFKDLHPDSEWVQQMEAAGIKTGVLLNSPVDSLHVQAVFMQWLGFMENNAYPFADIALVQDSCAQWKIRFHKGPMIYFDTLVVKGERSPDKNYLLGMLQFRKGKPYEQKWIKSISDRLTADGNYTCERAPEIEFLQKKARVYLYPQPIVRNQIMLLAGFQSDENGKNHLTGEADLRLYNLFQRGIEMGIQWKSPSQMEQILDLKLTYPYLFFHRLGLKTAYNLHRRDSTSILQEWKVGLLLPPSDYGQWEIQFRNRLAREQSLNQNSITQTLFYGMGFTAKQWYFMNEIGMHTDSKKSFAASVRAGASNDWEMNTWSRLYMKSRIEWNYLHGGEWNIADIPYWGGSNTLRGFQDLSLAGNSFCGVQADYHIILDKQIQIPLFLDIACLENNKHWNTYNGWGTGVYLVRKQGNIALYYALGQRWGERLDWKAYKIHITYAHRF